MDGDIHFVRLGLVKLFRFLVYPLVSEGARRFDRTDTPRFIAAR